MNKLSQKLFLLATCLILTITAVKANADQQSTTKSGFGKTNMVLLGTALKKFLTFRVVTVDLYIADGYESEDVLADIPKRLEVNYHVNIPKHELDRATIKGIKQNFNQKQVAEMMPQINQINSYYPDIKSGDQIAVTYVPGVGSQIQLNGQVKGIVPTEQFAKAFFSIWVGDRPVDKEAKEKLLGKKDGREMRGESRD